VVSVRCIFVYVYFLHLLGGFLHIITCICNYMLWPWPPGNTTRLFLTWYQSNRFCSSRSRCRRPPRSPADAPGRRRSFSPLESSGRPSSSPFGLVLAARPRSPADASSRDRPPPPAIGRPPAEIGDRSPARARPRLRSAAREPASSAPAPRSAARNQGLLRLVLPPATRASCASPPLSSQPPAPRPGRPSPGSQPPALLLAIRWGIGWFAPDLLDPAALSPNQLLNCVELAGIHLICLCSLQSTFWE
jgi:hypothetical protein